MTFPQTDRVVKPAMAFAHTVPPMSMQPAQAQQPAPMASMPPMRPQPPIQPAPAPVQQPAPAPRSFPPPPKLDGKGEMLTDIEQKEYFKGCYFIKSTGRILTPDSHYMNKTTFNAAYGGKKFIVDEHAKIITEAWQAATNSTLWTIPKVDSECFQPNRKPFEIITNDMGQTSVNTYRPATIESEQGDAGPFLRHIALLLPDATDQKNLLNYMAHNAQFPGDKIPWSPVIQSVEGAGKNLLKYAMMHVIGSQYYYTPKAKNLKDSGAKFNAWAERKLFIIVDEVRDTEKRELVEMLKDLISEDQGEVQGKGVDQKLADQPANWLFFTNWKDAIPINKDTRRFSINYSALQTKDDLLRAGMDVAYFNWLYNNWLGRKTHKTGLKIIANFLLTYPIKRGSLGGRAPWTTSMDEAVTQSYGPIAQAIVEAVGQEQTGFRNGWISRTKAKGLFNRDHSTQAVTKAILELGYHHIGRATVPIFQEDQSKPELFHLDKSQTVANYGPAQGYNTV